jgi:hypothetical protein
MPLNECLTVEVNERRHFLQEAYNDKFSTLEVRRRVEDGMFLRSRDINAR